MMDDEGLRDDIPIGVRAHRGIILKKIDALRAAADTAASAPSLLMNRGPAAAAVAASAATSEALAVAKRELAAAQEENAALREALAGDRLFQSSSTAPLLLGNSNIPNAGTATIPSLSNSGAAVRLSIRKPTGDYVKVEVGEQTLIAELKAELSNLTGMPLRTQVCTPASARPRLLHCYVHGTMLHANWLCDSLTETLCAVLQVLLHQFKELEDQRTVLGSGLSDKAVLHLKEGGTVRSANNLIMGGLGRRR